MTTPDLDPARRTAAILAFDVLHRPARSDLVAVADLAARVCGVERAAVTLLTDTEQFHVAVTGFDGVVCSLEDSLCHQVLHIDSPVVVPDCRLDPRLRDNPFVNGELAEVRFYASHRLVTRRGVVIGTLCVFDDEVRTLDEAQAEALGTLAERVVDILELSLSSRELAATLAEVEAVRVELEKSNDRLASFAGQISHDLKTPLTSMSLSLSLIREDLTRAPGDDDDLRAADALALLERAINGSTRMAALIDDVLAYAQVGSSLNLEQVALDKVVQHVRSDLWEHLEGVVFDVGVLPTVQGDEAQLRALLQNLLDNAAKFADPSRPTRIAVRAERSAMGWRVEVTDNGRGVPEAHLERIFEPMARADRSVYGTGIGLATCRRIVEAHGGRIGLEQVEPHGTTAWFELPG